MQIGLHLAQGSQIQPGLAGGGSAVGVELNIAAVECDLDWPTLRLQADVARSDGQIELALQRAANFAARGGFTVYVGGERDIFGEEAFELFRVEVTKLRPAIEVARLPPLALQATACGMVQAGGVEICFLGGSANGGGFLQIPVASHRVLGA